MTPNKQKECVRQIMGSGPDRVVVSPDGLAVDSRIAREQWCIEPDVIFVRNDGWSLAAPMRYAQVAFGLWSEEWAFWLKRPSGEPLPMEKWKDGVR